jgi:CRP/FNR family transcriptional regulator, anaerobic regulatory protein
MSAFSGLVSFKRKIMRGESLFRAGDPLETLYVIRHGAFKTLHVSRNGHEKVTGFYLPADMLGLDAIYDRTHGYDAYAIEDSMVCAAPFESLQHMAYAMPALQTQFSRIISADITRDHGLMLLMGAMSAGQRLAAFLLSLSHRYRRLGYSPVRFVLPMTREDIGSYLGLTIETVSRTISRFQRENLLSVHQRREVQITNIEELAKLVV